jgi:hypothetical protein
LAQKRPAESARHSPQDTLWPVGTSLLALDRGTLILGALRLKESCHG